MRRILLGLVGLIAVAGLVNGCGIKHVASSSIAHDKAPVTIEGKTYAYGDEMEIGSSSDKAHFCGDVISGYAVKQFPYASRFAVAVSDLSRDCSVANKFFRDFMSASTPVRPQSSDYWQGMLVKTECAGEWRAGACSAPQHHPAIPGGFMAQTMNATHTPYTDAHGFDGFRAIAVAF
jgi:hypothetical protein